MARFEVHLAFTGTWTLEVEAQNEDEALALAERTWRYEGLPDDLDIQRDPGEDWIDELE